MELQRVRISGPSIDALRQRHSGHEFVVVPMIRIDGVEGGFRSFVNDGFDQAASSDWFIITCTLGDMRVSIKVTDYLIGGKRRKFRGSAEVTAGVNAPVHEDVRLIAHVPTSK